MQRADCGRQLEVLELATSSGWPARADHELREHAASCVECGEMALVVSAIVDDRDGALATVAVPPSGAMWWKTQRRARIESEAAARRAVTATQLVSLTAALVLAFGALRTLLAWGGWSAWFTRGTHRLLEMVTFPTASLPLIALFLICVTVAPLAAVIALLRER